MREEERRKVIDNVRAAMGRLRVAAESVPAARFDERPAPEEWSANEVMVHVLEAGTARHARPAARPRPRPARLTGPHTATPWVRGGVRLSF